MKLSSMFIISVLISLTACGGGGGDKLPKYAGAWSGYVSLVSNTCPRQIPEEFLSISFLHNVDQGVSEDSFGNKTLDIVLNDGTDTYVGVGEFKNPTSVDDSFSAEGTPHELPGFLSGYRCIEVIDFSYESIEYADGNINYYDYAGYVQRHSTITCTKGTEVRTCDVTYTGSASK